MRSIVRPALVASAFALLSAAPASALMQVVISDTDLGVSVSYTGSLDLTGLTLQTLEVPPPPTVTGVIQPEIPALGAFDPDDLAVYTFSAAPGEEWQPYGSGPGAGGEIAIIGAPFYFAANPDEPGEGAIVLPGDYISGQLLSGSFLTPVPSLTLLGATPGSYSFALPNDSIQLTVEASAVPLPAAAPLLAAGLGGLALLSRRRRRG